MPYVYAFDHKHRRPPMDMKDLLGGKGANLAEMTSVLGLPVPPGFTITTDACRAYLAGGWPAGLDDEIAKQVVSLEKKMGRKLGDPYDPLLVSVRSGAKFSMPGHDGHRPQPRPQRPEREGPGRGHRATSASPTTPTAASSRCTAASCSASTPHALRRAVREGQGQGRRGQRRRGPGRRPASSCATSTSTIVQAAHRQAVPAEAA